MRVSVLLYKTIKTKTEIINSVNIVLTVTEDLVKQISQPLLLQTAVFGASNAFICLSTCGMAPITSPFPWVHTP